MNTACQCLVTSLMFFYLLPESAPLKGKAEPLLLSIIVIVTGPLWGRIFVPFRVVSPIKSSSKIGN